jgi:hypothetical protein
MIELKTFFPWAFFLQINHFYDKMNIFDSLYIENQKIHTIQARFYYCSLTIESPCVPVVLAYTTLPPYKISFLFNVNSSSNLRVEISDHRLQDECEYPYPN